MSKVIFVDFVNGDDAQDGLSPETAVRTPQRSQELCTVTEDEGFVLLFYCGEESGEDSDE